MTRRDLPIVLEIVLPVLGLTALAIGWYGPRLARRFYAWLLPLDPPLRLDSGMDEPGGEDRGA